MIALISVVVIACEQALLFGQAKQASRERASEGPRKGSLARSRETRFTSLLAGYSREDWQCRPGGYSGRYQGYAAGRLLPDSNLLSFYVPFSYTFFWQMMGPFFTPGRTLHQKTHKKTHTKKNKDRNTASYLHQVDLFHIHKMCLLPLFILLQTEMTDLPFPFICFN